MRDVFPFFISSVFVVGVSIMLHINVGMPHDMGDYIRIVVLSYVGGMVAKSIIDEVFYERDHYTLEDFYQRGI